MLELLGIAVVVPVGLAAVALHRAREANRGRARQWTLLPCMTGAQLTVGVWRGNVGLGVRVAGVKVEVVELGLRAKSQPAADVQFAVRPGAYSVHALPHGWLLPRQVAPVQVVAAGGVAHFDLELDSSEYHLHVDADRDGVVDAATAPIQDWQWGAGGHGAIIVVNSDTDGNAAGGLALPAPPPPGAPPVVGPFAEPDHADGGVNTVADVPDLAPIELRRDSATVPPNNWTVRLHVSQAHASRARVFHPRAANGARVLGPPGPAGGALLATHDFNNANLNAQVVGLGMEATEYPGAHFDGVVQLFLTVSRPADGFGSFFRAPVSYTERADLRVAPWMVHHHLDPAIEVHIADLVKPQPPGAALTNVAFRGVLGPLVVAAGAVLTVNAHPTPDGWMQDCMEIGHSSLPLIAPPPLPAAPVAAVAPVPIVIALPPANPVAHPLPWFPAAPVVPALAPPAGGAAAAPIPAAATHTFPVAARVPRTDPLQTYPKSLIAPDFGYLEVGPPAGQGADCGGNVEATPPAREAGGNHLYPWGRIYHAAGRGGGEQMNADLHALLHNQVVQPPIVLDAEWLAVNHVDEMISFVPAPSLDYYRQFALLIASPRRAYQLLYDAQGAGHGAIAMMNGLVLHGHNVTVSIDDFLDGPLPAPFIPLPQIAGAGGLAPTHADYLRWNMYCQQRLDGVLQTLLGAIEIPRVIEIPMLFVPYGGNTNAPICEALTAGSVNMLVINGHCIVPQPFGPVIPGVVAAGMDLFEADIRDKLQQVGALTIEFIDDWAPYHNHKGDVHCATNTTRTPVNGPPRWWEFIP